MLKAAYQTERVLNRHGRLASWDELWDELFDGSGPLGGAALRSCIHEGEGEPPRDLLLAAAACAAPGTVLGVPVQRLREDDVDRLYVNQDRLGVIGVKLLSLMLPAATSLRELG